ncbi:MAG: DNA topoisomerase, partial [Thermoplasmata archaeon]
MKRVVVICEKNKSAMRVASILSNGRTRVRKILGVPVYYFVSGDDEYHVLGLRGHIIEVDYPKKYSQWSSIKPEDLLDITPTKKMRGRRYAGVLRALAKNADLVIVATDYDREGELIGVEAVDI